MKNSPQTEPAPQPKSVGFSDGLGGCATATEDRRAYAIQKAWQADEFRAFRLYNPHAFGVDESLGGQELWLREHGTFPAPWRVDKFISATCVHVVNIVDANDHVVMECTDDPELIARAEYIVASRNGTPTNEDILNVRRRWQRAVEYNYAELEKLRALWHKEIGEHREQYFRLQGETHAALILAWFLCLPKKELARQATQLGLL